MFGNKSNHNDYSLIFMEIVEKHNFLNDKLKALEDYLQIEYKEETTKGYVKKDNVFEITRKAFEGKEMWKPEEFGNMQPMTRAEHGHILGHQFIDEMYKPKRGRKSNNKKK